MMKRKISVFGSLWLWVSLLQALPIDLVHGQQAAGIATRKLRRSKKDEPVMHLATRKRVLNRSEQRRLGKRIRKVPEDIQIVIADNVEYGFSPREISVELMSAWQRNDEISDRGILILVAMEQNRIEMEFGKGLSHIFDADWCHEILISKALPWFRTDEYAMGLEAVVKEIDNALMASKIAPKKKRKGKLAALAAMFGFGSYLKRRQDREDEGDFTAPPKEDRPHKKYGRRGSRGSRRDQRHSDSFSWRGLKQSLRPPPHYTGGSSSSGWDNWSYFLGRAATRAAGSNTKTANNVNVFYGGSPTHSSGQQESVRTRTDFGNNGYNPLNDQRQEEEQRAQTSTPIQDEPVAKSTATPPKMRPITQTKTSSFSGFKSQPFRPMETIPRKEPKNLKVNQGVKRASSSSQGLGGGSSWSTSVGERKAKEKSPTVSSSVGGGASWSNVENRPHSANSSNNNNNKKKENTTSSGTGGGASW